MKKYNGSFQTAATSLDILKIIMFSIAALFLNLVFAYAAINLKLIIFLDTVFTVAITFYTGLIPGVLVALFYNPLMMVVLCFTKGAGFFLYDSFYGLCGVVIALITWALSRNKETFLYSKASTIFYLIVIAFTSAIASCLCASILDTFIRPLIGQVSEFGFTDNLYYSFQTLNLGDFLSFFLPRIPITVVDRLVCTFAGYCIYKLVSIISPNTTISRR